MQTVIRRFGTKERLIEAAAEEGTRQVVRQRDQAPVGDIEGAVENLVDHYEEWADSALRLLAQEERVAAFRSITDAARAFHHEWVERTFAPLLAKRTGTARRRLLAELVAICDVYFWKLLRRDLGLSREQTELAITETILALKESPDGALPGVYLSRPQPSLPHSADARGARASRSRGRGEDASFGGRAAS